MITVYYNYFRKSTNQWCAGETKFWDCYKARNFMWSMRRKKMRLVGWDCDDPEDNQFLNYQVSIDRINQKA